MNASGAEIPVPDLLKPYSSEAEAEAEMPPDGPQVLVCAVCLYVAEGVAPPAVTVINGLAVCGDHAEYAMGTGELYRIIAEIRKEQREGGTGW